MPRSKPSPGEQYVTPLTPIRFYLESHLPERVYRVILQTFVFLNSPLQSVRTYVARQHRRIRGKYAVDPLNTETAAAVKRYAQATSGPADRTKTVSVIVPNYNYAHLLPERLASIARQTYPIHEIILLDDCSTDASMDVLRRFAESAKVPTKLLRNDVNSGSVFSQWKKGIEAATGDCFWIAEADDSSLPTFLECAMRGFSDDRVVLSYTESQIIDIDGKTLYPSAQALSRPFPTEHWKRAYIADGAREAANYLSINNTILNVSSVVFRRQDFSAAFERTLSFRLAGDWFFYLQVLSTGDIAYHPEPLNLYRMHDHSVRKSTAPEEEYREILKIHRYAAKTFPLSPDTVLLQRRRRDKIKDVPAHARAKRIAFLTSLPGPGSGGHRTLMQNINAAAAKGYDCDVYYSYFAGGASLSVAAAASQTRECCGPVSADLYIGTTLSGAYDLAFATVWQSAADVFGLDVPHKAYFIQDYEPWFLSMGYDYLKAVQSYRYGLSPISIGRWLEHVMETEFGQKAAHFDFCADLNTYRPNPAIRREKAVCAIYQPEKPRRCCSLVLETFRLLADARPDIKLYLFGSKACVGDAALCGAEGLSILGLDALSALYQRCAAGLSISSSNPSRIPFEMMACGLPVVELDLENNRYDFPADVMLLAKPLPEALAAAILRIIDDAPLAERMSKAGADYMKDYPLEKGYAQFTEALDTLLPKE